MLLHRYKRISNGVEISLIQQVPNATTLRLCAPVKKLIIVFPH